MAAAEFGKLEDGRSVTIHTLRDEASGAIATVSEWGASLVSLQVIGRDGILDHVVLGYSGLEPYLAGGPAHRWHFGNTVGRNANRIASSGFDIDGVHYDLELNNAPAGQPCHLHGGSQGFGKQLWETISVTASSVTMRHVSPDLFQQYPGEVTLTVTYTLRNDSGPRPEPIIEFAYCGTTTKTTILNPTNHAYWNLSGHRRQGSTTDDGALVPITDHLLTLPNTTKFTPTTAGLITTGELLAVAESCFDFTKERPLGDALATDVTGGEAYTEQRLHGKGIDHNFCLDGPHGTLRHAARLADPARSGLVMDIFTTAPGIQVYTGNFLEVLPVAGHEGVKYDYRTAACFETQFYPNAINHPAWPSPVLKAGEEFRSTTLHRFSFVA